MKDFESLAHELRGSEKKAELERLAASAGGGKLEGMIDGAALERAVRGGDAETLRKMLGTVFDYGVGEALVARDAEHGGDVQPQPLSAGECL